MCIHVNLSYIYGDELRLDVLELQMKSKKINKS